MLKDDSYGLRCIAFLPVILISKEEEKRLMNELEWAWQMDYLISVRINPRNDRYMLHELMSPEEYAEYVNKGGRWHFVDISTFMDKPDAELLKEFIER